MFAMAIAILLQAAVYGPVDPSSDEGSSTGTMGRESCREAATNEIVVCRRAGNEPRLPLPDERAEAGEVIHHPSELPPATNAFQGPPAMPSRLGETIGKGINLLRGLITGADTNPEP
jgi:hypothetical protein